MSRRRQLTFSETTSCSPVRQHHPTQPCHTGSNLGLVGRLVISCGSLVLHDVRMVASLRPWVPYLCVRISRETWVVSFLTIASWKFLVCLVMLDNILKLGVLSSLLLLEDPCPTFLGPLIFPALPLPLPRAGGGGSHCWRQPAQ